MKEKKPLFTGAACALITPFLQNGAVDTERLCKLTEFQIQNGTSALVVCGTTAEASTLTEEEQVLCIQTVVSVSNGRVPVIAGAGSNNTQTAIRKTIAAQQAGADALLHITPYYNLGTAQGIMRHFFAIADASKLPIILYHVPGRTGVRLDVESCAHLAEHTHIVGIKDATGDVNYGAQLLRRCNTLLDVYCGCDGLTVPYLSLGAKGVISVLSNLEPQLMRDMCRAYFRADTEKAAHLQLGALPMIQKLFSNTSPAPLKYYMAKRGMCENVLRLPLSALDTL